MKNKLLVALTAVFLASTFPADAVIVTPSSESDESAGLWPDDLTWETGMPDKPESASASNGDDSGLAPADEMAKKKKKKAKPKKKKKSRAS